MSNLDAQKDLAEQMNGEVDTVTAFFILCYFCDEETARKYIAEVNKRPTFFAQMELKQTTIVRVTKT